jgi:hypothetical protein
MVHLCVLTDEQVPLHLSDAQEERVVHGKLEGLAHQYNTLLASQLDEQRAFYEKQMARLAQQQVRKLLHLYLFSL